MTHGIKALIYPVKDLANAKTLYSALLGIAPSMDEAYYVGFTVDGLDVWVGRASPEVDRPAGLPDVEFWLYDDRHVVLMHYDADGRFVDAEALPSSETARFCGYRDLAVGAAVPFADWWRRHPEVRRDTGSR